MTAEFEWDAKKANENPKKHGVGAREATPHERQDYEENTPKRTT